MKEVITKSHLSEFTPADTLNKAIQFLIWSFTYIRDVIIKLKIIVSGEPWKFLR